MVVWSFCHTFPSVWLGLVNPRRMREDYSSHSVCVCVCVCVCVTALAATYLICMSKVRHHRVPCRLLKIYFVWTSLKCFVREIWRDLPATMIHDSALSRQETHQWY